MYVKEPRGKKAVREAVSFVRMAVVQDEMGK